MNEVWNSLVTTSSNVLDFDREKRRLCDLEMKPVQP